MQKLTGLNVFLQIFSACLLGLLLIRPWLGYAQADLSSEPPEVTDIETTNTVSIPTPSAPNFDPAQDFLDARLFFGHPDALVKSDLDALTARLTNLESAVSRTHEAGLSSLANSHRTLLVAVCTVSGVGIFIMLLLTRFQLQAMHRLTAVSEGLPVGQALAPPQATAALNAVERLDKRLRALEDSAFLPSAALEGGSTNAAAAGPLPNTVHRPAPHRALLVDADSSRTALLVNKADTLLSLNHPEDALACLDEAITLSPTSTAALLKRGVALERLSRIEEAIAAYDRALEVDRSATLAYLFKGGLFSRLERYGEALECYQQALQTQDTPGLPARASDLSPVEQS
jgi:hypothetical protein